MTNDSSVERRRTCGVCDLWEREGNAMVCASPNCGDERDATAVACMRFMSSELYEELTGDGDGGDDPLDPEIELEPADYGSGVLATSEKTLQ